ncbi:hypothetical protein HMPREF3190_00916 [Umbribacter vaginalis]|nr:hypothetical protein HMPREF3190_00916 [Coriobacteriales bacterium DNF00809]
MAQHKVSVEHIEVAGCVTCAEITACRARYVEAVRERNWERAKDSAYKVCWHRA